MFWGSTFCDIFFLYVKFNILTVHFYLNFVFRKLLRDPKLVILDISQALSYHFLSDLTPIRRSDLSDLKIILTCSLIRWVWVWVNENLRVFCATTNGFRDTADWTRKNEKNVICKTQSFSERQKSSMFAAM